MVLGASAALSCCNRDPATSSELDLDNPWTNEELASTTRGLYKGAPGASNGDWNYCDGVNLCVGGEGDCDSNAECTGGAVCGKDNGAAFGMPKSYDVCVAPHCIDHVLSFDETGADCGGADCGSCNGGASCTGTNGDLDFCVAGCSCGQGQGDCDYDSDCQAGLVCKRKIGDSFGLSATTDVCVAAHCRNAKRDADETGKDCGGADCQACPQPVCHPSVTFDGSTGWASVPSVPATTSFTIEGWVNGGPPPSQARIFGTLCGSLSWDVNGFWAEVFPDCNGTSRRYANDFVAQVIPYTSFPSDWFHLAMVVPAPNQVRIYVNGQLVASSNSLPYDDGVVGRYCGSIATTHDCGHGLTLRYSPISVSDFRVSNGARYSGNFTPAQPLTSDASTVVRYDFLEGGGTRLTDRSGGGRDGTLMGRATWSCPSQESYAIKATSLTSSLTCNNSGFGIGHGNFTFEFWIKAHDEFASSPIWGTSPAGQLFTQNESYAANAIRPRLASGGQMYSYTYNTFAGPANIDHITGFVDDGRWHHYALVREGSNARTYMDGALSATQSGVDPNVVAMSNMAIGKPQAYSEYTVAPVLLGPIRYSSTVRYSSAFVPAKTWTVDGNTIAQYLTTTPFDGTTLQDEAGRDNDCTYRSGWIPSQGP